MTQQRQARRQRRPPKPLTPDSLRALALHYVGRYATSSGKLSAYLGRKVRECGWDDATAPPIEAMIEDFVRLDYVDDAGFAAARSSALLRRGFGASRIKSALRQSGVGEVLAVNASAIDEDSARQAAFDFARRKRIGPYGGGEADPRAKQRAFAAMARAGHDFSLIKEILATEPASLPD